MTIPVSVKGSSFALACTIKKKSTVPTSPLFTSTYALVAAKRPVTLLVTRSVVAALASSTKAAAATLPSISPEIIKTIELLISKDKKEYEGDSCVEVP